MDMGIDIISVPDPIYIRPSQEPEEEEAINESLPREEEEVEESDYRAPLPDDMALRVDLLA